MHYALLFSNGWRIRPSIYVVLDDSGVKIGHFFVGPGKDVAKLLK